MLGLLPSEAQAGWQNRRTKCVKPANEITSEQQQSLSAAVRGGTVAWNAAGEVDQASASASTHQVMSQNAYDQAWIRYELCTALDNNHIDQATYTRLMEESLQRSFTSPAPAAVAAAPEPAAEPAPEPAAEPAAASSSSTAWQDQIRQQTELRSGEGFANMAGYNYTLLDVAKTGLLDASTSEIVPLSLPGGYEYALMAVCDDDCSDLDLAVLKSGVELSVDTSQDDWPVVPVTPTGSGDYSVKVVMYQCSTKNCGYQLTVWQRPVQATAPAPAASAPSSGTDPVAISSGSVAQGALSDGDLALPNGEWADRYTVSVSSGQQVQVSMASGDIDTFLVARAPSGATEQNDDCDGDRARSCLNFAASEGGDWTIYATSYGAADDGSYELSVEVGAP